MRLPRGTNQRALCILEGSRIKKALVDYIEDIIIVIPMIPKKHVQEIRVSGPRARLSNLQKHVPIQCKGNTNDNAMTFLAPTVSAKIIDHATSRSKKPVLSPTPNLPSQPLPSLPSMLQPSFPTSNRPSPRRPQHGTRTRATTATLHRHAIRCGDGTRRVEIPRTRQGFLRTLISRGRS